VAPVADASVELVGKYFRVAQLDMSVMIGTEEPDCGLGGIGKTTLARQFACEAAEKGIYAGIWWLRANKLKDAVLQPGYLHYDRLLRPAMVNVAKGGPANTPLETPGPAKGPHHASSKEPGSA
jgi:hypothetical protein